MQARTIDTCGVLVSSDAGKKHDRSGDAGATIARFVCLHLITSDGLMSSVHPMQHLAASAYVLTPEPWDVFDENDLAINTPKESANGTSGDDEIAIPPRAVPTLHTTLAGTRILNKDGSRFNVKGVHLQLGIVKDKFNTTFNSV